MKIDLQRLSALEQVKNADRGAWQKADDEVRAIRTSIKDLATRRDHLKNSPPVVDKIAATERFETIASLQKQIDAAKDKLAGAQSVVDAALETMAASQALFEACEKYAGVA